MVSGRLFYVSFLFVAACANSATIEEDSLKTPTSKQDVRPQDVSPQDVSPRENDAVEPQEDPSDCGIFRPKKCPPVLHYPPVQRIRP